MGVVLPALNKETLETSGSSKVFMITMSFVATHAFILNRSPTLSSVTVNIRPLGDSEWTDGQTALTKPRDQN